MRVLGLTGYAGSGKDYTYAHLKETYDGQVARLAFADGVRHEIEDILARPNSEIGKILPALWEKPYPPEVRALLQWWGTEFRRAQDPDYWVKKGIERLEEYESVGIDLAVVTDVRFANEAQAIKEIGGLVVEVVAADHLRKERLGGALPPVHDSEVIDFPVDFHIISNHGLEIPWQVTQWLHTSSLDKQREVE